MSDAYKISGFRILKVECDIVGLGNISIRSGKDEITLKIGEKLKGRRPKNAEDKILQIEIDTTIDSDEVSGFKIHLLSQAIFQFSEIPDNIEDVLQNECYPEARSKVYDAIKTITGTMGISPLDLNKKYNESEKEPG